MPRRVSIVEARRELGRLTEEVRRTGQPVVLTRRGSPVARITPEPAGSSRRTAAADAFGGLTGTVRMHGSFEELRRAIRELRTEYLREPQPPYRGSPRRRRRHG